VLFEPEIPPNTGNVIRLCANTGAVLHLVGPLGFRLDARSLRRAGLDYVELADVRVHVGFDEFLTTVQPARCFAVSTRGTRTHDSVAYRPGDSFVFGPESRGLPDTVVALTPISTAQNAFNAPASRPMLWNLIYLHLRLPATTDR
jgi:tRNA (cytidine/uridine-2'-O-)-methyltransferase